MSTISENIQVVREKIAAVCYRIGRRPEEIEIVGVTKTWPAAVVDEAIRSGIRIIGENRVQEAAAKKSAVKEPATWHLVGHLQTNKARKALQLFDLIQSVDSLHLAEKLDRECEKLGKTIDVLVQVNTSGEASKFGVEPGAARELVERIAARLSRVRIRGLMTIGLFTDDPTKIRPCFAQLRELSEAIRKSSIPGVEMRYLSMGMSDDFPIALEEGANMLRLGRVLFGERTQNR